MIWIGNLANPWIYSPSLIGDSRHQFESNLIEGHNFDGVLLSLFINTMCWLRLFFYAMVCVYFVPAVMIDSWDNAKCHVWIVYAQRQEKEIIASLQLVKPTVTIPIHFCNRLMLEDFGPWVEGDDWPWLIWIAHGKNSVAICVPVHPVVMLCVCVCAFVSGLICWTGGRWSLAQVALRLL